MYKIKVYTCNLFIDASDDIPKAKEYLERKIRETANVKVDFVFDVEKTKVRYVDIVQKLMLPLDGQYDVVMYMFDRSKEGQSMSFAWPLTPTLRAATISTYGADDAVGGTWMCIAHELMHGFFQKLHQQGINTFDPMDWMYVDGVKQPYYKNWEPEAPDGNFAYAFKLLAPFWLKIDPQAVILPPVAKTVTITRSPSTKHETLGSLVATNGAKTFTCKTLELPWLNNAKNISCIPKGTYQVKRVFWLRKLKYYYQVQNVPGRTGIFIHEGNYYHNYEGCIGLGKGLADINHDGEMDITDTVNTIKAFETFMNNEPFQLTIT